MKLKIWEYALICAVTVCFLCGFTFGSEQRELSDKLIRLHVVANSDSEADQALKLQVRDAVLEYLRPRLEGAEDATQAGEIISDSMDGIKTAADKIADRPVTVTLARESFPTVEYDTFALPAGEYTSLRVIIGDGAGHNWWCVVFPPVCDAGVIDEEAGETIGLTGSEVKLITQSGTGYAVRFRTIELIERFLKLFK